MRIAKDPIIDEIIELLFELGLQLSEDEEEYLREILYAKSSYEVRREQQYADECYRDEDRHTEILEYFMRQIGLEYYEERGM